MAIFRKVHTSFWSDPFIQDLDKDQKLFYLYLLTNERTKQCGIYEITKRQISFDLGCSIDTVSKHLQYFINQGKILFSDTTNEVAIKNWDKYNQSTSPKVISCIKSELKNVKDTVLIEYVNGMYTASQEEQEEEQEKEQEELNISFDTFWNLYDLKKGLKSDVEKKWNKLSDEERELIVEYIPKYIASQPDKQFRKQPLTFLNKRGWEDEIIVKKKPKSFKTDQYLGQSY